jgi:tetratricopeptide (TPR) repeat protein
MIVELMRRGFKNLLLSRLSSFSLLVALLLLSACSQLPMHIDRVALVDGYVEQQQFRYADQLLQKLTKDDPQFTALDNQRRALPALIAQYEQQTLAQVKVLTSQHQWEQALSQLDSARAQLPEGGALEKARPLLLTERDAYLSQLNLELDLLLAQQLPARNAILEKILAADPDSFWTRWKLFQQRRLGYELADQLLDCVEESIEREDLGSADRCLQPIATVAKISQQTRLTTSQQRLAREIQRQPEQIALRQQAVDNRQQLKQLKREYRELLAAGWWTAAREKMTQLQVHTPSDTEVEKWLAELEQIVSTQVELGIQKGQALYSQGFLQQALTIWRDTARLSPENTTLQAHIQRAERFIEKLQRLES